MSVKSLFGFVSRAQHAAEGLELAARRLKHEQDWPGGNMGLARSPPRCAGRKSIFNQGATG